MFRNIVFAANNRFDFLINLVWFLVEHIITDTVFNKPQDSSEHYSLTSPLSVRCSGAFTAPIMYFSIPRAFHMPRLTNYRVSCSPCIYMVAGLASARSYFPSRSVVAFGFLLLYVVHCDNLCLRDQIDVQCGRIRSR